MSIISEGPYEGVELEVGNDRITLDIEQPSSLTIDLNEEKVELDLQLRGITLSGQHQTWAKFEQLRWGRLRATQWARF